MNICKTVNDYRKIILDRCQGCEFLFNCMYDICISRIAEPDYIAVGLSLEYLDRM